MKLPLRRTLVLLYNAWQSVLHHAQFHNSIMQLQWWRNCSHKNYRCILKASERSKHTNFNFNPKIYFI